VLWKVVAPAGVVMVTQYRNIAIITKFIRFEILIYVFIH